jgi:hypothetical protein
VLVKTWRALDRDQQLAGCAAWLLFASMFLPWYQQNAVVRSGRAGALVSQNLNAFEVFSFVEAMVLLLAAAVVALLFARAEGRHLRLPASDGALIMGAGGLIGLLLVYRLFEKPGISGQGVAANVGIQWGIFFALLCAGLLIQAGSRMRSHPPRLLLSAGRLPDGGLGSPAGPPARPADVLWADEPQDPTPYIYANRGASTAGDERERPAPYADQDAGAAASGDRHEDLTAPYAGEDEGAPASSDRHEDLTAPYADEDEGAPASGDRHEDLTATSPDAHEDATWLLPVRGSRPGRGPVGANRPSAADGRLWQLSFEDQPTDDTARLPGKPD